MTAMSCHVTSVGTGDPRDTTPNGVLRRRRTRPRDSQKKTVCARDKGGRDKAKDGPESESGARSAERSERPRSRRNDREALARRFATN